MATSYDRRISFYINGKEITNDLKSIRAEMTKLVNEQARMTIGSDQYIAHARHIRELKGILAEHNLQVASISKSWSLAKIGDQFNRYFSMIQAGAAALVGLVLGFKALVKVYNDFEERVGNLSALTGLTGTDLDWLAQKAKKLSTSTLESGIIVTQSATEIVDAFTKVGSARPDLLKNKEALTQVTQEAILLSNAAKIKLQPAIEGLTMVMNQYNVPADQARRIINALGAGSKEGAGEIPYLTTGFEKTGITAKLAGLSIETLVATLETLAPRFSQPEIAGRGLRGMLLKLQTGADDTNPAIVGMATALENLGKKGLGPEKMLQLFGLENIAVAQTLITNVEELKKYEKAVKGTNVAVEQAIINTNNNNAKLAQAGNRINVVAMELGKKLVPAMHSVTGYFGMFLRFLTVLIDAFTTYGRVIVSAVLAIAGYVTALKIQTLWQGRSNQASILQIITQKAQAAVVTTMFLLNQLWAASLMLVTGNLKGATQAMRVFTNTIKLNPIGLITTLIVGAASAIQYYIQKKKEAAEAANNANRILKEERSLLNGYSAELVKEKNNLTALVGLILRTNEGEAIRGVLIKKLRDQYPDFLGLISKENISNRQLAALLENVNSLYSEKIKLAALRSKSEAVNNASVKAEERKLEIEDELVETEKQRYRVGDRKSDERVKKLNEEYAVITANLASYKQKQEEIAASMSEINQELTKNTTVEGIGKQLESETKAREIYQDKLKKAREADKKEEILYYEQQLERSEQQIKLLEAKKEELLAGSGTPDTNGEEGDQNKRTTDLIKLKEQELETARMMPGSTRREITLRNQKTEAIQKEIEVLNNLGKTHSEVTKEEEQELKELEKKELEKLDAQNKRAIAEINSAHLKGRTTDGITQNRTSDDQYKAELLIQEFSYLKKKMVIFKEGSKEYEEANSQIAEKQLEAEKMVNELIIKAETELANARIANLREGIEKEKQEEAQRWEEEKDELKKRIIEKKEFSEDELKLNGLVHKIIEEKEKAHQKKMEQLEGAADLEKTEKKLKQAGKIGDNASWYDESVSFMESGQIESYFKEREALIRECYENELKIARDNQEKIKEAEEKYTEARIKNQQGEVNAYAELFLRKIGIAQQFLDVLSGVIDQESALGKAIFLFQQGLAVANIWISTAQANMKAVAALVLPPLWGPVVAANNAFAGIQTALVLAQTVAGFIKGSRSSKEKGYESGGYTGDGESQEPAGIVHKGEYIIPREGVFNPRMQPFISMIEMARKNNRLRTFDLNREIFESTPHSGYSKGGASGIKINTERGKVYTAVNENDRELKDLLKELSRQLKAGIKASATIKKYGRNGLTEAMEDIERFKGKVYRK